MNGTAASTKQNHVILVSGLPRSGTSMMMQMLGAGGVPLLIDEVRRADSDNPAGYYEFEPVKRTRSDASWVRQARGKAVKIVYRLLYDLPADVDYRVLFMHRRLSEVFASQNAMLDRTAPGIDRMSESNFAETFAAECRRALQWLGRHRRFEVLEVDYNQMLESPRPQIEAIDAFLGGSLDHQGMNQVVQPSLYRQRG